MSGRILEYDGPVVAKPRMTQRDRWKKRSAVEAYYRFKDAIRLQASNQGFHLGESFSVRFYFPMPKSWSQKKKRELAGKPHQQKPDLDNLLKSVQDCLLPEDSAIHKVEASKVWWASGFQGIVIINEE